VTGYSGKNYRTIGLFGRSIRSYPQDGTLNLNFDQDLDAQGLICPEPLMLARNKVREMSTGEVLHISATDPSTHRDFVNFCRFMGHELLRADTDGPVYEFWIQKGTKA
jgi:tRNA 2-thiouridine synthesizing protein A